MKVRSIAVPVACGVVLAVSGVAGPVQAGQTSAVGSPGGSGPMFVSRTVATDLQNPWEITSGPDGMLWVTEKSAGRVTRVSPVDGTKTTAVTVDDVLATPGAQDGLLGMALDPGLLKPGAHQYVYVAYTYDADPGTEVARTGKIVRYTYEQDAQRLLSPVDLITGLPAGDDHESGRLVYGPDHRLYYTIGDLGAGQSRNFCRPNAAQSLPTQAQVDAHDWSAYQGKIIRLDPDGSVPADNPVLNGVRSHVFSYGHRNAQGLAFGPHGRLYSSEQGPKTDDEINLIEGGRNYGWPRVAGARDDKAYVFANWSASTAPPCEQLTFSDYVIPASVPQQPESTFTDPAFTPPLTTFGTVDTGYQFQDPACPQYYLCWPTIAPSSLEVYPRAAIRSWGTSLLVPSLKDGTVYRVELDRSARPFGEPDKLWRTVNRYRDTAVSRDGTTFYVATDSRGTVKDLAGQPTTALANPGSILEFRYAR